MIKLPIKEHDDLNDRLQNYYNQILEPYGAVLLGSDNPDSLLCHTGSIFVDSKTGVRVDHERTSELVSVLRQNDLFGAGGMPAARGGKWVRAYPDEVKAVIRDHRAHRIPNTKEWKEVVMRSIVAGSKFLIDFYSRKH
jgi:hypothetical protein